MRVALLLLALVPEACGFPRPDHVGDDDAGTDAPIDAELPPGKSIRVSGTGDDANDGITAPVKTLKHAIGLAAANSAITSIVLATGRYSAAGGETFPYTVPPNLTILGPAGGGAILAGSKAEPGMVVNDGTLRDLELEDFTVAITATGASHLAGLHIRTGATAIRAEAAAKLTADSIDIVGAAGACALGIELHGAAELTSEVLVTRALRTTVDARDQSVVTVAHANITGDATCSTPRTGVFLLSPSKSLALNNSAIDGGDIGILCNGAQSVVHVNVMDTTIRNTKEGAVNATQVALEMTGGEISGAFDGITVTLATVTMLGVTLKNNRGFVMQLGDGGTATMRTSKFFNNGGGIYLYGTMMIDAGTAMERGANVFQNGESKAGIDVDGGVSAARITAVGNTWRPGVQGADAQGHYASTTITGQTNFNVPSGGTLQL